MRKMCLFAVMLLVITSCVSQKKYAELQKQYKTEQMNHAKEKSQLNSEKQIFKDLFSSSVSNSEVLYDMAKLLERELTKYENYHDSTYANNFSYLVVDSIGVCKSYYSLNHAYTKPEALVFSFNAVQDSIKALCNSIRYGAIEEYKIRVNGDIDSSCIHTEPDWLEFIHPVCHEVWKDTLTNTYWALEIQRFYWNDFIENNISGIVEMEGIVERLVKRLNKEFEDKNPDDYGEGMLYFHSDEVSPRLDAKLYREILINTIGKKGY